MTITIGLPPEMEARLSILAVEQGMATLQHLFEKQVLARKAASLSPGERARLWRESAKGMPHTPLLSVPEPQEQGLTGTKLLGRDF